MTGVYFNSPTIGLGLRRKKMDTPVINTYAKQMQQCQRLYNKIPFDQEWNGLPSDSPGSHSARPFDSTNGFDGFPLMMTTALVRRRSSGQVNGSHRKPLQVESRRQSRTEAWSRRLDRKSSICRDSQLSVQPINNNENHNGRRTSVKGMDRRSSVHRKSLNTRTAEDISIRRHSKSFPLKNSASAVAENDITNMNHLDHEKERLFHALTTLAINSLTCGTYDGNDRIPYMDSLTPCDYTPKRPRSSNKQLNSNLLSVNDVSYFGNSEINSDEECRELFNGGEDGRSGNEELSGNKRERINKLRNYLKSSGVGEPVVVTTSASEKANENLYLMKMIKKMRRGLSPHRQERLKLKAKLEYEMCIMRAESFCEQQEQLYMRTASADMENRDLQLLEEDLKHKALQEMNQQYHHQQKQQDQQRRQQHKRKGRKALPLNRVSNRTKKDDECCDKPDGDAVDEQDDNDDNYSLEDAMSGLLRSPMSRAEMTQRILRWLAEVEKALGGGAKQDAEIKEVLVEVEDFDADTNDISKNQSELCE